MKTYQELSKDRVSSTQTEERNVDARQVLMKY